MAMLRCDSVDFTNGLNFLTDIKNQLQLEPSVQVIGPVPAAMARRAGRYRAQLLLLSEDRRALHNAASQLAWVADKTKKRSDIKWFMDVDPAEAV
jgi:primosomal protein N' (replication factor Y)